MIQFTTSVWMIQSFGKTGLVLKFSSFLKESSANSDLTLLLYDFRRPVIWHTSYMDHFYDNFAFFLKLESSSPHLLQLHGKEQPTHSSKFQEWKSYGLEMGEQMMTEFVFFGELSHYVISEQNEKCRYIVLRYMLRKKQLFPHPRCPNVGHPFKCSQSSSLEKENH